MSKIDLSRRATLALALAAGTAPAFAMNMRELSPLGFQAHTLRVPLARDFAGTLNLMRAIGFEAVELAYFPGYAGATQGDFGRLGDMPTVQVRDTIKASGLKYSGAHFLPPHLIAANFQKSVDWAKTIGLTHIIQAGLQLPQQPTMDQVKEQLDVLNETGARVRAAGLTLGFHSDAQVWRTIDGQSATDEMMRRLDPQLVKIQMDFGTIVQASVDGAAIIDSYPGRIYSVHLRDAKKPANPLAYLPASPLGTGDVDWVAVMRASKRAGVKNYVVEMTRASGGVIDAMKESYDYLRTLNV